MKSLPTKQLVHEAQGPKSDTSQNQSKGLSRRRFMAMGLASAAGLALGVSCSVPNDGNFPIMPPVKVSSVPIPPPAPSHPTNAFVWVPTKGKIQVFCHRSEMGQGVRTAIPMLIAEELYVSMSQVEIILAKGDPKYGDQNTDGSKSISRYYKNLRQMGASAREMLVQAAANRWKVKAQECEVKDGVITHAASKRKVTYGEVAEDASKLTVPKDPALREYKDFKIIGKATPGKDLSPILEGKAPFGMDIALPNMLYGCAQRSPIPGGSIKKVDDSAALKIGGVKKVIKLPAMGASRNTNASVCVLADNTWSAIRGKQALKVEWELPKHPHKTSKALKEAMQKSLKQGTTDFRSDGDTKAALAKKDAKLIRANYYAPFLAHAPMEPPVCTAWVKDGSCEVWAPCQDPIRARRSVANMLEIDAEKVTFHVTFLGGGFGRKSQPDFILETVAAAKEAGVPVKLTWTREDEIKHGFYHAESYQQFAAALGSDGLPRAWHHQSVFPTLLTVYAPTANQPSRIESGMGATNMPYKIPNVLVEVGRINAPVRIGWFRSVCNLFHAFGINSFLDELAAEAKVDPIEYRLKLLGKPGSSQGTDTKRMAAVINKTKEAFGWDKALPKGHGKGFANHFSFSSYVAVAVEASVTKGRAKIHRAVITIDCGLAVNPDGVKAQMEGSVVFGLSAALYGKITFNEKGVEQGNFDDYRMLRMEEMPKVEVHIINGNPNSPAGVGEPGVPPIPSAVAAALYMVTKKRMRELPFDDHLS